MVCSPSSKRLPQWSECLQARPLLPLGEAASTECASGAPPAAAASCVDGESWTEVCADVSLELSSTRLAICRVPVVLVSSRAAPHATAEALDAVHAAAAFRPDDAAETAFVKPSLDRSAADELEIDFPARLKESLAACADSAEKADDAKPATD